MPTSYLTNLPPGICILTESGDLGVLEAGYGLRTSAALTQALAGHIRGFLDAYRTDPHAGERRVAIVHYTAGSHPWASATLSFEDQVVRALYPAGGRVRGGLTSFQQRQRHRSLYRGMELMLEYRRESRPDTPVYCPVLYAVPTGLADRAASLGRALLPEESEDRVMDVLNLATLGEHRTHDSPAIRTLNTLLQRLLINKQLRCESSYELMERSFEPGDTVPVPEPVLGDVPDWQLMDEVTLPQVDLYRPHESERVDRIECWLRIPHTPVKPERLREFVQFREMDEPTLNELAARSLLYSAPGGAHLLDNDVSDAWNLYLLDGSIMLTAADGATLRVDGGSHQARYPISFLKPRKYRVDGLSPINFLWIHDMLLAAVNAPEPNTTE